MIMPSEQNKKRKENRKAKRKFVRILRAAEHHIIVFDVDYENHTARGLLLTKCGARQIILAFDAAKDALTLIVVLPTDAGLTMSRVMILLRLQNYTAAGSSSISFDPESTVVRVKSHAILPDRSIVQPVVSSAMGDTLKVLENEDFRHFVN